MRTQLEELQYAIYESENPISRFDQIEARIIEIDIKRRKDLNIYKDDLDMTKKNLNDRMFFFQNELKNIPLAVKVMEQH